LTVPVEEEFELLFAPVDDSMEIDEDSVRPIPKGVGELNLANVIREEVLLSVSPLALCKPDCKGLCPQCGINLNENRCECSHEESDPRWEALRELNEERE
jgi:uncharacterized protein